MHAEARSGSREDARNYCLKDDSSWFSVNYPQWEEHGHRVPNTTPVSLGIWKTSQGNRTDLDAVYDLIYGGSTEKNIFDAHPREYLKYHAGIRRARHLQHLHLAGKYCQMQVEVIYGDSRTGKTRSVMEEFGAENVYSPVWNGQKYWFSDYDGQDVLLLDEFTGQIPISEFQKLLDNYHMRLEAKGSNPISRWTKIRITTNVHPRHWYNDWFGIPAKVEQSIINRISAVRELKKKLPPKHKKTWDSISTPKEVDSQYYLSTSGTLCHRFLPSPTDGPPSAKISLPLWSKKAKMASAKTRGWHSCKNCEKSC